MTKEKILVIVESPTKIKTLKKYLPSNYEVESSVGHIRDLPKKKLGIDIDNNFTPEYENLSDKKEVISTLKKKAKECDLVLLAPDPDREGEAISWHIASILPKGKKFKRISFTEITKQAILESIKNPHDINQELVNAQQARRLLDRLVGFKISPILHRKMYGGNTSLSAGRVQSVALKLVVDREKEIEAFKPTEYWNLGAFLKKSKSFKAHLYQVGTKRIDHDIKKDPKKAFFIRNAEQAQEIEKKLQASTYQVSSVEKKVKKRNPSPPFITSSMQQEAHRYHGFSAQRTMSIAQSLYEGVSLGKEGPTGLITYMRTDATRIAKESAQEAKKWILAQYGEEYYPEKPNVYSSKKGAQEAHEAIRPTNIHDTPEKIKSHLNTDQYKLYSLIWKRFVASQMHHALFDQVTCMIKTNTDLVLSAVGSTRKFAGYLSVYIEKEDDDCVKEEEKALPPLKEGQTLALEKTFSDQAFTKPPGRFTEASLIKEMVKKGIGRPSTYAAIMNKIVSRQYTLKENKALRPTDLGRIITTMLENHFSLIMNIGFTADMEEGLDKIAIGEEDWKEFLKHFWDKFSVLIEKAAKEATVPSLPIGKKCPECKKGDLVKVFRRGSFFIGCSDYPECPYSETMEKEKINKEEYDPDFDWDQKCPKCSGEMEPRKGPYGFFLGCKKYPECRGIAKIDKKKRISKKPRKEKIYQYKAPLAACTGVKQGTKKEALILVWKYIKDNDLQNPKKKRKILPDEKLAVLFETDKEMDMMKMTKLINANLE